MTEVKEYCDEMGSTLSTWKNEMCEILNVVELFPEADKKLMSPQISTLHDLVEDLSNKIERLKRECPIEWGAAAGELDRQVEELRKKAASMWDFDHIAGGYVGG